MTVVEENRENGALRCVYNFETDGKPCSEPTLVKAEDGSLRVYFVTDRGNLYLMRDQAGQTGDFSDPAYAPARALKDADTVVIAAPYWDLSFPASLKIFIENVLVTGLVFAYGADSIPHTLCKMKRVVYLTTSGGYIGDMNTGEVYIRQLCKNFLGDPQVDVVFAEGLDIWGNDVEGILTSAREKIDALF